MNPLNLTNPLNMTNPLNLMNPLNLANPLNLTTLRNMMREPWSLKFWKRKNSWKKVSKRWWRKRSTMKKHQIRVTISQQCGQETLRDTTGLGFPEERLYQRGFQKTMCRRSKMCLYDRPRNLTCILYTCIVDNSK